MSDPYTGEDLKQSSPPPETPPGPTQHPAQEIGASPHVDVADAQPQPVPGPSPYEVLQKALDGINHSGNLDLQGRLLALETFCRTIGAFALQRAA
jgi:hypothetical protein